MLGIGGGLVRQGSTRSSKRESLHQGVLVNCLTVHGKYLSPFDRHHDLSAYGRTVHLLMSAALVSYRDSAAAPKLSTAMV